MWGPDSQPYQRTEALLSALQTFRARGWGWGAGDGVRITDHTAGKWECMCGVGHEVTAVKERCMPLYGGQGGGEEGCESPGMGAQWLTVVVVVVGAG